MKIKIKSVFGFSDEKINQNRLGASARRIFYAGYRNRTGVSCLPAQKAVGHLGGSA